MERMYPQLSKERKERSAMIKFLHDKFEAKAEDLEQESDYNNSYFVSLFELPNEKLISSKIFYFFFWIYSFQNCAFFMLIKKNPK